MKALTQSEIAFETERWAAAFKKLERAEAERDAEIEPLTKAYEAKVDLVNKRHDPVIDKLQKKVDEHGHRVMDWLGKREKTTTIESKSAVAEVVHGMKNGVRKPDLKKLLALCKKKGVDFWQFVTVVLGELDKALGKKEVDAVCEVPQVATKTVSLRLK